jgi:hypothetical protein
MKLNKAPNKPPKKPKAFLDKYEIRKTLAIYKKNLYQSLP